MGANNVGVVGYRQTSMASRTNRMGMASEALAVPRGEAASVEPSAGVGVLRSDRSWL